jgi:putative ABC transport system permease protein
LGWGLQSLIVWLVATALAIDLAQASFYPWLVGAVTGITCIAGFALPPLWNLRRVPAIRVLRREVGQSALGLGITSAIGLFCLLLLVYGYTGDPILTSALFAGLGLTVLIVGSLAWLMLRGSHWAGMQAGNSWRLATASLRRRALENALQIVIFAVTLMLVLVLLSLRTSLIDEWQQRLPAGTPNYFLVNVAPDEIDPIHEWLQQHKIRNQGLYPIIRARLTHINQRLVQQRVSKETDDTASVDRELNLTYSDNIPEYNRLITGRWWLPGDKNIVSVESQLAERLNIQQGDTLQFQMGATRFNATVANIREVDWERMRPSFYMIFPPAMLESYPATFITSFYLAPDSKQWLADLVNRHPTVQILEVDAIINKIRTIISQVSMAIESVLWAVIACGALVLIATVRNSQQERLQETAILRSLGAPTRLIMGALCIEFAILGVIAGLLAAAGADLTSGLLQKRLFDLPYQPQPLLWLLGPALGCALVASLGLLASRKVVKQSPMLILRDYNFT